MIVVPCTHHRQRGTHDAAALAAWLSDRSWLPVSADAINAELADPARCGGGLIPPPHGVWVREQDRIAEYTAHTRGYLPDQLERYGWQRLALFDLGEVVESLRGIAGFRCRSCGDVCPWGVGAFADCPTPCRPEDDAVCAACGDAANAVLVRRVSPAAAMQMPWRIRDARQSVRALAKMPRKRMSKAIRRELAVIAKGLNLLPEAEAFE